jgi:diguanylate cyclase (GGDEF)-like protein
VRTAKLKATKGSPVTLSIGVALLGPDELDFADAISRADHAMYTAKRAGRDRFVMHEVVSGASALTSST